MVGARFNQMVAPNDEVAEKEMEIDDDGEKAGGARAEPCADEPGSTTTRSSTKFNTTRSRSGTSTQIWRIVHIRAGARCVWHRKVQVIITTVKRHNQWMEPLRGSTWISFVAEGTFVGEPRAKATVLVVICKDEGNLFATEVLKTDEYGVEMVLRFLSTCRDQDGWRAQHR